MNASSIIAAVSAAIIGALIWAGVAIFAGLEIGWIAWGIGGLIGGGAAMFGGEGFSSGITCALLALVAIFIGKWIAIDSIIHSEIRDLVGVQLNQETYNNNMHEATAFSKLTTDEEYRRFMIHFEYFEYTEAASAEEITEEELSEFKFYAVPNLNEFYNNPPAFEDWKEERLAGATEMIMADVSIFEAITSSLHPLDILFAFLGIVTAYKVGSREQEA